MRSIFRFSQLFKYPQHVKFEQLSQLDTKYKSDRSFTTTYKYIRELSRQKQYVDIINVYNDMTSRQWKRYRREADFRTLSDWIDRAHFEESIEPPSRYLFQKRPIMRFFWKSWLWMIYIGFLVVYVFHDNIHISIEIKTPAILTKEEEEEDPNKPITFKDVIGIDDYKEELQELVDYLKNPKKYTDSGARLPKGILLVGKPGTGKTLLAKALAGEAECNFIYKSGAEFDEMFVGVGASRVRALFEEARKKKPSIIFIDEIDSIGGQRSQQKNNHTINQILTEMDGFHQDEQIIVIGATNFANSLDPAFTRAGRFDKIINIIPPDVKGRTSLFEYYLKKIKHTQINTTYLARQTTGMTGAEIQNVVNLAILNAIRQGRHVATPDDFSYSIDRIRMGVQYKITNQDKELTAYHEGGHALVTLLTDATVPLDKVTILPRGGALGYTSLIQKEDKLSTSRANILAQIDVAMGGRAAEELQFGNENITSGCSSDLARATQLAYSYVRDLGMGANLISDAQTSKKFSYEADMQVKAILDVIIYYKKKSYQNVFKLLQKNKDKLQKIAEQLLIHETLTADQVRQLI